MSKAKKKHPAIKTQLHPRNKHRQRYDFDRLIKASPALTEFVKPNKYGDLSIDFFNPAAVKALNKALLQAHYQIEYWDIPPHFLCPPIPGRADHIHYLADLLAESNGGKIPTGETIRGLDIGMGANAIYPILGHQEYGWSFVGSEIDKLATLSAEKIVAGNPTLKDKVEVRMQQNPRNIFDGIFGKDEVFDFTICNPPFYESEQAVRQEHLRKMKNLKKNRITKAAPNFGGKNRELWCDGGEKQFVGDMIRRSKLFSGTCFWFTALVSRAAHLDALYKMLANEKPTEVKTISMAQGNKTSQILAWTFLSPKQQKIWAEARWR